MAEGWPESISAIARSNSFTAAYRLALAAEQGGPLEDLVRVVAVGGERLVGASGGARGAQVEPRQLELVVLAAPLLVALELLEDRDGLVRAPELEQRRGGVAEGHALELLEPKASGHVGCVARRRHRLVRPPELLQVHRCLVQQVGADLDVDVAEPLETATSICE